MPEEVEPAIPDQIIDLTIRNYRVLRDVRFTGLTPMTALLGPNGSGKSTVFDVLVTLQEMIVFDIGRSLSNWRRGFAELRSRGSEGPIEIGLRSAIGGEQFDYRLALEAKSEQIVVREETLRRRWDGQGQRDWAPLLEFRDGSGTVYDERTGEAEQEQLADPGILAVSAFSTLKRHGSIADFRSFLWRWRLSNLDLERMRAGDQGHGIQLTSRGENLGFIVQEMQLRQPGAWKWIIDALRRYVPGLEDVIPERLGDGRRIVKLKERGVAEPILPEAISDGTLKLLGHLVALRGQGPVLLLEEPENNLHPRLHYPLAEDIRAAAESSQVIVATHAPRFVDALRPEEVWMTFRGEDGYTQVRRASEIPGLTAMVEAGGSLGSLWAEGYFDVGDPLAGES